MWSICTSNATPELMVSTSMENLDKYFPTSFFSISEQKIPKFNFLFFDSISIKEIIFLVKNK